MKSILAVVAVILLAAHSASAQWTYTFDENGTITSQNGPGASSVGGAPPSYTIPLGFPTIDGDLIVNEPFGAGQSDVVRFVSNGSTTTVTVFSDNLDAGTDLADVGLPTLLSNTFALPESKAGGGVPSETDPAGVFGYTQGFGSTQPGAPAVSGTPVLVYNFYSETPEPASALLMSAAAVGLLLRRRTR